MTYLFKNILINEKSYENLLFHNILEKTFIDPETLRSRFDKIDGFIGVYDGTRYFILLRNGKYDSI